MTLTRSLLAAAALSLLAPAATWAQDEAPAAAPRPSVSAALTLTLESAGDIERIVAVYQCSGGDNLTVHYINAAPNFLAIVPVEGENHVFATTISASGARYVSGPFEWWSRGDEATLRDLMQDENAEPLLTCSQASNTP